MTTSFPQFVGFVTAHAVWQTEEGDNVIPILAFQAGSDRRLERVMAEDYGEAAARAQDAYEAAKGRNLFSLCVVDGYVTLPSGERLEALNVDAVSNAGSVPASLSMAVPYRSASSPEGLAIYRPKILGMDSLDVPAFIDGFWEGVDSHAAADDFWNRHMDQSL